MPTAVGFTGSIARLKSPLKNSSMHRRPNLHNSVRRPPGHPRLKAQIGPRVMLALCLAYAAPPTGFAVQGVAVVGSYQNKEYADAAVRRVNEALSMDATIVETDIDSTRWFRVVVDDPDGAMVSRLGAHGFQAWFLPHVPTPPVPLASTPTPVSAEISQVTKRNLNAAPLTTVLGQVAAAAAPITATMVPPVGAITQPPKVVNPTVRQDLIGSIDGIPRHRIDVPSFLDREVDIAIDGRVDEPLWQAIPAYDNMLVYVPATGEPGPYPTEVRMLATERGLFVSAVMYQPPDSLVSRITSRDQFIDRDSFAVTLDTSGEGLFAYWFVVALGDSFADGKVLPERRYQPDWDGAWIGKSARFEGGWSMEMLLSWSMMTLPKVDGPRKIGFAMQRQISHSKQTYQWPGYPFTSAQFVTALNTMEVSGVQPRQQFSVIPYASNTVDKARGGSESRLGADIFWKPSPKLELTASVLPDFGNVEADDVVLNLSASETFFPEKRLFFLEGSEVFASTPRSSVINISTGVTNDTFTPISRRVSRSDFFPRPISLLNTRRIGGTATQVIEPPGVTPNRGEDDLPTDVLGAVKLTGGFGNLRYGALGAAEEDVEWFATDSAGNPVDILAPGRDFVAARLLYESVGASRKSVGYVGTLVSGPLYDAAVHGIDGHFTSSNHQWFADIQLVSSDVAGVRGYGGLLDLKYSQSPRIQHKMEFDYFDDDIDLDDLGFLRRNDYAGVQYAFLYNHAEGSTHFKDIRGAIVVRQQYNLSKGQVVDSGVFWRNSMVLPGRNTLKTALAYLPERWEDINSDGNGAYLANGRWWGDIQITTDAGRMFSYSASIGALQEDLGDWTYAAAAGVTFRPSDWLALDLDLRYKRRNGWIVHDEGRNFGRYHGPDWQPSLDVDWFISAKHQLRLSLQWAGVEADERGFFAVPIGDGRLVPTARTLPDHDFTASILTVQLRYRWEIAPLTDFYLVYNLGNELPDDHLVPFSDLFDDALADPIVESFVAKLRYRFGN